MINHDAAKAGLIDISGHDLDKLSPDVDKSALGAALHRISTRGKNQGKYRGFSNCI